MAKDLYSSKVYREGMVVIGILVVMIICLQQLWSNDPQLACFVGCWESVKRTVEATFFTLNDPGRHCCHGHVHHFLMSRNIAEDICCCDQIIALVGNLCELPWEFWDGSNKTCTTVSLYEMNKGNWKVKQDPCNINVNMFVLPFVEAFLKASNNVFEYQLTIITPITTMTRWIHKQW